MNIKRQHAAVPLLAGSVCVLAGGCAQQPPKGFDSPEPAERMHAAVAAAKDGDQSAIPELIELLASDDPATRMVSILTLQRLTGQTMGYDYAAGQPDREIAIQRWVAWQSARTQSGEAAAPSPASTPRSMGQPRGQTSSQTSGQVDSDSANAGGSPNS